MFDLLNVNEAKGLTIYEIENGIVDMTQTGDLFDRYIIFQKMFNKYLFSSEKAINDAFKYASKFKYEKTKDMEEKLDFKQMKLFIRILRMTYCFYQVNTYLGKRPIRGLWKPLLTVSPPPLFFTKNVFTRPLTISTVTEST